MHPFSHCVLITCFALPLFAQDPPRPQPSPAPVSDPLPEPGKAAPKPAEKPKVLELGGRIDGETTLVDIDGKAQKARDLLGKITVVNFYSIQCPVQAGWDNRLAQIQKDFEGQGVVFLHVDSNVGEIGATPPKADDSKPYEQIRKHLAGKQLPFRVLVDHGNKLADLFAAQTTPHVFVFGKDGRLVYKGLVDDDQRDRNADGRKNHLRDVLGKLAKDEKVEPFATREVGCAIKRVEAEGQQVERPRGPGRRRGERGGE